jgi:hypothetical protein
MKIEAVRRCGAGVEIKIGHRWFWFALGSTIEDIKKEISKVDNFDCEKYEAMKDFTGREI